MTARPLGSWVVVEPVRQMVHGRILVPMGWSQRHEVGTAYSVCRVLAIGADVGLLPSGARVPLPFEVGDWLVVENFVGHPGLAGWEEAPPDPKAPSGAPPRPGRVHVVDLDCGEFGGTPGKQVAIVPFLPLGLPVVTDDEAAARRVDRIDEIQRIEHLRKTSLDAEPDPQRVAELEECSRWLAEHEERRAGCRRSRRMHPTWDPGRGEGVLAVIEDLEAVLALGACPIEVSEMLAHAAGVEHLTTSSMEGATP